MLKSLGSSRIYKEQLIETLNNITKSAIWKYHVKLEPYTVKTALVEISIICLYKEINIPSRIMVI